MVAAVVRRRRARPHPSWAARRSAWRSSRPLGRPESSLSLLGSSDEFTSVQATVSSNRKTWTKFLEKPSTRPNGEGSFVLRRWKSVYCWFDRWTGAKPDNLAPGRNCLGGAPKHGRPPQSAHRDISEGCTTCEAMHRAVPPTCTAERCPAARLRFRTDLQVPLKVT